MNRHAFRLPLVMILAAVFAPSAHAQELASGPAIMAAISGNSVRGHMVASGSFEEYYDPSGAVRGADYTGTWAVTNNQLCLAYDGDPANCWGVQIEGATVVWIGRRGEEGSGTIVPGNPNGF